MKKRLLSFLLVLVMLLGIVPFSALTSFASEQQSTAKSSDVETVTVTTFDELRSALSADGDADFKCDACGMAVVPPEHVCDFGTELKHDSENHWYECACGEKSEVASHGFDNDEDTECDECGYIRTISHEHIFSDAYERDENNHWNECECGEKNAVAAHTDENTDGKCDTCGKDMPTTPDDPTDDKDGLGTGAIVGIVAIVVGSVLVVGAGIFALVWFVIKKKKG